MKLYRYFIFLWISLYSLSTFADQLLIEPNAGRAPLVDKINHAKQSVELVMYGFTDQTLLNTILKAKDQGKQVNIILESTPYKFAQENDSTINKFKQHKVEWQGHIPNLHFIHQKTLILDHKQAIVMTFNFTNSSFKNQRNFALLIDNPQLVHEIDETFNDDWQHKPSHNPIPDLIYSPEDSRAKLTALINHAKHSINIYAQNITDYKIVGSLAKAARNGIDVRVITSRTLKEKQARYLTNAGVKIRHSNKLYIHAKAMIIDQSLAVVGSINFTRASLDNNRELSVITHDTNVIKQLNDVFTNDWDTANGQVSKNNLAADNLSQINKGARRLVDYGATRLSRSLVGARAHTKRHKHHTL